MRDPVSRHGGVTDRLIPLFAVEILDDKGDNRLTLMACNPKYSAKQRIVVEAKLVGNLTAYLKDLRSRVTVDDLKKEVKAVENKRSYPGFNFFDGQDREVLEAIGQGEFCISGMQNKTLRQLLPWSIEYRGPRPFNVFVPAAHVVDRPRFGWRGAFLDVSRHFFSVAEVERNTWRTVGLGSLGGYEMRYGSDLDLVFLFGADGQTSTGVEHREFYARVARRRRVRQSSRQPGDGRRAARHSRL